MQKAFKVLGISAVIVAIVAIILWWWFVKADTMTPPRLSGEEHYGSLEHDGLQRNWMAYVPSTLQDNPPLLIVMHGSRGDSLQMRRVTRFGFDVLADRDGMVVVYPEGFENHWNDCRSTASYSANTHNIDDVGFLRALVQRMVEDYGVDPARVFATGFSNGGQMAYRLGLEAPELVAGISAISANLPQFGSFGCRLTEGAVPALVMNGTADPFNPFDGGPVELFGDVSRGEVMSSQDTARYWAQRAGYSGAGENRVIAVPGAEDDTSVERTDWLEQGKAPVSHVAIVKGGHTIPHRVFNLPRFLGPTSHQLDGPEVIWTFFKSAETSPH